MRYLLSALALLALAGCANYGDAGYAYDGYSPGYASGYGYDAPYGYGWGFYARTSPYGVENCGTPYNWRACPAW